MSTPPNAIEVTHLSKQYKEATSLALNDVTFKVRRGEIYGILGPNGAGKTTLMSILFGSIKPTMGSFSIVGLTYKDTSLRYKIGVVPQEYALYPTLTARENLHYFGSLYGLKGKQLKALTDEAIERVALASVANKKIAHFCPLVASLICLLALWVIGKASTKSTTSSSLRSFSVVSPIAVLGVSF